MNQKIKIFFIIFGIIFSIYLLSYSIVCEINENKCQEDFVDNESNSNDFEDVSSNVFPELRNASKAIYNSSNTSEIVLGMAEIISNDRRKTFENIKNIIYFGGINRMFFEDIENLNEILHTHSGLIQDVEDFIVLSRIIDNEAGSRSSEAERACVGAVVVNRCRESGDGVRDCIAGQISQWSREFLSDEYVMKHRTSYIAAASVLFGIPEQCNGYTHYFSPISMARANSEIVDRNKCVTHMEDGDRRHSFIDPNNGRYYLCDSREGFLYYYSDRGGVRNFPGLGQRIIPGFANSNRFQCDWNGSPGIDPNRFIFCRRADNPI